MRNKNRCILKTPTAEQFYVVDANFLVYRFLNASRIADNKEKGRAEVAKKYWTIIDQQRKDGLAKVFALDVCIAEAFKVLAKKYYKKNSVFPTSGYLNTARKALRNEISLSAREASKSNRKITFHDIQTTRDIVIGVDRFFEKAFKMNKNVGVIDLLILSTCLYLVDFLGFDRERIHFITMDGALYDLARTYAELPSAFNPDRTADAPAKVFV